MSSGREKRAKTLGENDIISTLPLDVLHHILSLLPTKSAARTSTLSTFWKQVFSSSTVYDFNDALTNVPCETTKTLFRKFVLNVLLKRNRSPIEKFRLCCVHFSYDIEVINLWIACLVCFKVREIDIEALVTRPGTLFPLLFNIKTLTTLKVCGNFMISTTEFPDLPQLKIMHLKHVVFSNEYSASCLFARCPILEDLNILFCKMRNIGVLDISVDSLKKLGLFGNEGLYKIVLNAANLEEIYYSSACTNVVWGPSGKRLNSLVKAVFFLEQVFDASELVNRICNVKDLSLTGGSMQGLFRSDQPLPIFHNLTCLEVFPNNKIGWNFLPSLLANSPRLQVLSFSHGLHDPDGNFLELAHYLPEGVSTCVSSHLKEVKFGYFLGARDEFKMIEYFLKNAKVLEKITISPSILSKNYQFLMTKRLLTFQRCSQACRIFFTDEFLI